MSSELTRRELLIALLGTPAALLTGCGTAGQQTGSLSQIQGAIVGPSDVFGHQLRDGFRPEVAPDAWTDTRVVIVGSGVSGLSAAWRLLRAGFQDFVLLELEDTPGGTARSGSSAVSAYPWGAHYLPAPQKENVALTALLNEMGVLEGADARGQPVVAEQFLCRDPQERIFYKGRWYEGLYLHAGASAEDLRQFNVFTKEIATWAAWRDGKGRPAFSIPVASGSDDAEVRALDDLSMDEYLRKKGLDSPRLRWYVEYACRDDYGAPLTDTSAWAGIFYFASRQSEAGHDAQPLITWPEGNGRLVEHLFRAVASRAKLGVAAADIAPVEKDGRRRVEVVAVEKDSQRAVGFRADKLIFAAPQFLARRFVRQYREEPPEHLIDFDYSAWAVANLTLRDRPGGRGFPLCWDNVLYESPSLGYVVATHQSGIERGPTVFTWYYAYCGADSLQARHQLLTADWAALAELALADLATAHPEIRTLVERVDVMRWGHAMIIPKPGFIWGGSRQKAMQPLHNIHFAHTDLSGVALFEEAFDHGLRAAEEVFAGLNVELKERLAVPAATA